MYYVNIKDKDYIWLINLIFEYILIWVIYISNEMNKILNVYWKMLFI